MPGCDAFGAPWAHFGHIRSARARSDGAVECRDRVSCELGTAFAHALGDVVEISVEQVGLGVGRHRRRLVPEHLLHDLHVRARRDGEARRSPLPCVQPPLVRLHPVGDGETDHEVQHEQPDDEAEEPCADRHDEEEGGVVHAAERIRMPEPLSPSGERGDSRRAIAE